MKKTVLTICLLSAGSLLLAGCTLPTTPAPTTTGTVVTGATIDSGVAPAFVGSCGLKIYAPALNSTISSNVPVVFSGVIDNTDAQTLGCQWTMFEWQAGNAQLYYKNGNTRWPIGVLNIIHVANWMTTGPEPFTVSVVFNNSNAGFQPGTPMKVTFTEENPSGAAADTFDFPLVLQ